MFPITRILCPIDFSEYSRHALHHALGLADAYDAQVTAVHVLQMPAPVTAAYPLQYPAYVWTAQDLENLDRDLAQFVQVPGARRPVASLVAQGNAGSEIVRQASLLPADLLVMGTHGRSGFERFMLGSVAERVVRHAPCPVLTVPPKAPDAAGHEPIRYRRILCAVDFSEASLEALSEAAALARDAEGTLTVIHVVEPLPDYVPAVPGIPLTDYDRRVPEPVRTRLQEVTLEAARGLRAVREIATAGRPHEEILRAAAEDGAALIVIGVEGRGVVDIAFFGSTANRVLRGASCPVLTSGHKAKGKSQGKASG
jgi:nucleotide-binding universal stress UspA family protein